MMWRTRRRLCVLVGALWLSAAAPELALGEDPPHAASKREKREKRRKKAQGSANTEATRSSEAKGAEPKAPDQGTSPRAEAKGENSAARDAARAAQDAAQGANSEIVKEGDTSVKVMEFSGLDIEGRLKSPQLLYFVNRVRAEFDRPRLPHRSFMPELESSTKQEPLQ
jgi:hypothetical protein